MTEQTASSEKLLIIDDEANMRHMLRSLLQRKGYTIDVAADGQQALEFIARCQYHYILCDLKMPVMDGMAFLVAAGDKLADTTVIMMSAYGSIDTAVAAMKQGAYDYISKPFKTDEVLLTLKKAQERKRLREENVQLKMRLDVLADSSRFGRMQTRSKKMKALFKQTHKIARYDVTVLITGESGTGKELIAKGIHFSSARAKKPLVAINCGGIPEQLLESELFGYRKGAFTGAERHKTGLMQSAGGGTLFLDEIGELPFLLQVKLLRALQEREVRPVGATATESIDVRFIAATSRNLEQAVTDGHFREDLFYRLNVIPIHLPPLRERTEDIPLLAERFVTSFNREFKKQVRGITPEAMAQMLAYPWPGNVRELENVIERAVLLAETNRLEQEYLLLGTAGSARKKSAGDENLSLKKAKFDVEKRLIIKALQDTAGNRTRAARLLEISHPALLAKMRTYGIDL